MERIWKTSSQAREESERAAFWSQSGASLREKRAGRAEGREKEGREAAIKEDREKAPEKERELWRLENSYGRLAVKKMEGERLGIEAQRTGLFKEETADRFSAKLEEGHMSRLSMEGGWGYVDSHRKTESDFLWTQSLSLAPERIMEEIRRLRTELNQDTLYDMLPGGVRERQVHGHSPVFKRLEAGIRQSMEMAGEKEEKGKAMRKPFFQPEAGWGREDGQEEEDGDEEKENRDGNRSV